MPEYRLPLPRPWTLETLPEYVDQLALFITKYQAIGEYISVGRFLNQVPLDWGENFSLETWLEIIVGEYKGELPDDFAEYMRLSRCLRLVDNQNSILDAIDQQSTDQPLKSMDNLSNSRSQKAKRLRTGCCPKKNHELDILIAYLESVTTLHSITTKKVLEVGAGVGHLASELVKEGYSVIAIDGDEKLCRKCAEKNAGMPQLQCITKYVNHESDLNVISEPCISVCLRTSNSYVVNLTPDGCGDLSVNHARHFVCYENVKLLIDIPCCYNRSPPDTFPISKLFREKNLQLSRNLREQAAQCVDHWSIDSASLTIRKHFYRAVLEVLLQRHGISISHVHKQNDRVYAEGFKAYVTAVVRRNGLAETLIEETGIIDEYKMECMFPAVCLRAMCAAVAETLLVLDRWMYVKENLPEGHVILHGLFDPEISPRQWAIVAVR